MLQALADAGLGVDAVDWLLLTHVHLDHAGGPADAAAAERESGAAPARCAAHDRPDPADRRCHGGVRRRGNARSYGRIEPIPAQRVVVAEGHRIDLAGRERCCCTRRAMRCTTTVWDARSRSWFTGDTFGISYRELDSAQGAFIFPLAGAVRPGGDEGLDPAHAGLRAAGDVPDPLGAWDRWRNWPDDLFEQIDAMAAIGRQCDGRPDRHRCLLAALQALYLERAQLHGCALDDAAVIAVLAMDIELNAQGLACWLDRIRP